MTARTPFKNKDVERAYFRQSGEESVVEEQKTADRRIYWYVFAIGIVVLFQVAIPLPWEEWGAGLNDAAIEPAINWVRSWL